MAIMHSNLVGKHYPKLRGDTMDFCVKFFIIIIITILLVI
jgi:hypothetical protein